MIASLPIITTKKKIKLSSNDFNTIIEKVYNRGYADGRADAKLEEYEKLKNQMEQQS